MVIVTASTSEHGYTGKVEKLIGHFSPRRDFHEVNIIINFVCLWKKSLFSLE